MLLLNVRPPRLDGVLDFIQEESLDREALSYWESLHREDLSFGQMEAPSPILGLSVRLYAKRSI